MKYFIAKGNRTVVTNQVNLICYTSCQRDLTRLVTIEKPEFFLEDENGREQARNLIENVVAVLERRE